jgi:hypothetical protein
MKIILVGLTLALAVSSAVLAQAGAGYELSPSTVDGGGGESAGGDLRLTGTAGQPDAGLLAGGGYVLAGGFWGRRTAEAGVRVYLPLTLRGQRR